VLRNKKRNEVLIIDGIMIIFANVTKNIKISNSRSHARRSHPASNECREMNVSIFVGDFVALAPGEVIPQIMNSRKMNLSFFAGDFVSFKCECAFV
jgi:hypothetical protein